MNWLTAKVAQGLAAALLVLCLGLMAQVWAQSKRLDAAAGKLSAAQSARDAAVTERDSWKEKAADAIAANKAYDVLFEQQREAAEEQQRLAAESAKKAAAAVAAAQREEAEAEREAAAYRRVYGARPKDCEAALLALDRVCPTLRNY